MNKNKISILLVSMLLVSACFALAQTKSPLDDDYKEEKLPKSIDTRHLKVDEAIIIKAGYRYPKGWIFSKLEDKNKRKVLIGSYSGDNINKTISVDYKFYNWLSSSIKNVETDLIKENALTLAALCPDYLTISRVVKNNKRDDRFYCMGSLSPKANDRLNHLFERLDLAVQNYYEWYKTASN